VDFEVLDDIMVKMRTLVIAKGGLAFANGYRSAAEEKNGPWWKLDMNIDYVKLVSGEKAALRAVKDGLKVATHRRYGGRYRGDKHRVLSSGAAFPVYARKRHQHIPREPKLRAYVNATCNWTSRISAGHPPDTVAKGATTSGPGEMGPSAHQSCN